MKIVKIDQILEDKNLFKSFIADINDGAVAVIPTDTLYGFAVAANNCAAIKKIYEIKNRDAVKPLILFLEKETELKKIGFSLDKETASILTKHWPGALTAILQAVVHPQISAFTYKTIGIRIPAHPSLLKLLENLPFKLLTTSANRSGSISKKDPKEIAADFSEEIDWLIDGGILEESLPSTIVDFSVSPFKIIRQGKITL